MAARFGSGAASASAAGGQGLALLLCDDDELRLHYHAGYEPEVVDRLRRLPLTHPYPALPPSTTKAAGPRHVERRRSASSSG